MSDHNQICEDVGRLKGAVEALTAKQTEQNGDVKKTKEKVERLEEKIDALVIAVERRFNNSTEAMNKVLIAVLTSGGLLVFDLIRNYVHLP